MVKKTLNQHQGWMQFAGICLVALLCAMLTSCGYFESEQTKLAKAGQYYQDNEFNRSIVLVKKILQSDSGNCPARVLLGQNQFAMFSLLDARETMKKAKQQGCKEEAVFTVALKSLMYQNRLADAQSLFDDHAFIHMANSPQGLLLKGDLFFLKGNADEASKYYTEFYSQTHNQAEHCLSEAKLLSLKKNFQGAIDKTAECEKLKPAADKNIYDERVRYVKALAQLKSDKTDKGMTTLQDILAANGDPKDPNLKIQSELLLMKLNVARRKIDAASKLADRLLHYVALPDIYHVKGLYAEQEKRYDIAEQQYLAALKLNPNFRPSLLELAKLKYKEGNIEQAKYYTGRMDALSGNNVLTERLDDVLAEKYLKEGDLDSIINTLANDKKYQNNKSGYILALAYARKGEREKAWQVFHGIKFADPVKKDLLEAQLDVAMGDDKQAEILFGKYVDAGNEYAITGLGQLYIRQKKYAEAEKLLHGAIENKKNQFKATALLVEMYAVTNQRQKAFTLLDNQIKSQQNKQAYQLLLAKLYFRYAEFQDTIKICLELHKADPDNLAAQVVLANSYIKLTQYNQAEGIYKNIVKKQPADVNAYLALAFLANKSGDTQKALDYVEQALDQDPLNLRSIYTKVELLVVQHAGKEAVDFAKSKADALKNTKTGSLLMAFAYDKTGDEQKAYINYRSAQENGDRNVRTALRIYHTSVSVNGAAKAGKELDDFLHANPSATNIFYVANYFMQHSQYPLAEKYYLAYIKQNQKNPGVYNNLAWLKLKDGDTKNALMFAHRADELAPGSPAIQDTLGQVLLGTGDIDKAGEYLKAAYAKLGDNPSVKYHMALFYFHKNMPKKSKELLNAVAGSNFPEQAEARELLRKLTAKQP